MLPGKRKAPSTTYARIEDWDASSAGFTGPWADYVNEGKWKQQTESKNSVSSLVGKALLPLWFFKQRTACSWTPGQETVVQEAKLTPHRCWPQSITAEAATRHAAPKTPITTVQEINAHVTKTAPGVTTLAVSSSGQLVATGGLDTTVQLYSLQPNGTFGHAATMTGHVAAVRAVLFLEGPRGPHTVVSAAFDGTIRTWDLISRAPGRTLELESLPVLSAALNYAVTSLVARTDTGGDIVYATLAASSKGAAKAMGRHGVLRWRVESGQADLISTFHSPVNCLSFTADGSHFITGDGEGQIRLYNTNAPGTPMATLGTGATAAKVSAVLLPSDRWAVTTASHRVEMVRFTGAAIEYVTDDGRRPRRLGLMRGPFRTGQAVQGGSWADKFVTGSAGTMVYIWDTGDKAMDNAMARQKNKNAMVPPITMWAHYKSEDKPPRPVTGAAWHPRGGVWSFGLDGRIKLTR